MTDEAEKGPEEVKEPKTGGPEDPIFIQITMHPGGAIHIHGPAGNPVLFLGLLEVAKQRVLIQGLQAEMRAQVEQQEKQTVTGPRLYTPDGIRIVPKRMGGN